MKECRLQIPFNKPSTVGKELEYINDAIVNGQLSGNGKYTKLTEKFLSTYFNSSTLLTSSCTHSLEMSAKLLQLEPGDEVILPSFTFVSTANAFILSGAKPVFADIDLSDLNIDITSAEKLVTKRTKAICIVHYSGAGASPDSFKSLSESLNIALIEDNAHGFGGKFRGKKLGTFGEMSTLSFHETKNVISGEGGALVVNDHKYMDRAEILRDKGTNRANFLNGLVDKYTWVDEGSSWIMSELQSAYLYGQIEKLEDIEFKRTSVWNKYKSELNDWANLNGVAVANYPEHVDHTSHLFFLRFPTEEVRNRFISYMQSFGITTPFHYQALHDSDFAKKFQPSSCPNSSIAARTLVRLPLYFTLSDEEQGYIISKIKEFNF
jgi:dTDP-4-amino-4,6-dideoxygalactose transaminase